MDTVFAALQGVLPQRLLSSLTGRLCRLRGGFLTRLAIRAFVAAFRVDLSEARQSHVEDYPTFNAFFTRELAEGVRPLEGDRRTLACPADGRISALGAIERGTAVQAKGLAYPIAELLGDPSLAARFDGGHFVTVYLSPRDYHRVHMPLDGTLGAMRYVPGRLYSVNAASVRTIPGLFCRNERVAAVFDTTAADGAAAAWALVMVGALNVGSIALNVPAPGGFTNRPVSGLVPYETWRGAGGEVTRGAEFGRFNMGSTVIVLASAGLVAWDPALSAETPVRVGQALGRPPGSN